MLKHKPDKQRFYYFPAMMRSEAMAIKVWDSASSAVGGTEENIAPFSCVALCPLPSISSVSTSRRPGAGSTQPSTRRSHTQRHPTANPLRCGP